MIGGRMEGEGTTVRVQLDEGAYMPERAHEWDAGADLRTPKTVVVGGRHHATIDTGVHVEIPEGYVGMLKSKSGLNVAHSIVSEGVIDSGYTGSIVVKLYNHSVTPLTLRAGDKVSQLVIMPCLTCGFTQVDEISGGPRGDAGFGSTGK